MIIKYLYYFDDSIFMYIYVGYRCIIIFSLLLFMRVVCLLILYEFVCFFLLVIISIVIVICRKILYIFNFNLNIGEKERIDGVG